MSAINGVIRTVQVIARTGRVQFASQFKINYQWATFVDHDVARMKVPMADAGRMHGANEVEDEFAHHFEVRGRRRDPPGVKRDALLQATLPVVHPNDARRQSGSSETGQQRMVLLSVTIVAKRSAFHAG